MYRYPNGAKRSLGFPKRTLLKRNAVEFEVPVPVNGEFVSENKIQIGKVKENG